MTDLYEELTGVALDRERASFLLITPTIDHSSDEDAMDDGIDKIDFPPVAFWFK